MVNYKPQLFLRTADTTVGFEWPEGTPDPEHKMVSYQFLPIEPCLMRLM